MEKKVTISDVAERANVSKATVSRVLNRPEIVAPELLNRIQLAMSELNYQPNRHARALSGVHTKTVGLLFFEDLWDLVLNPFWAMATSTVYDHLQRHDLDCSLISLGESVTSQARFGTPALYEEFLRSRNVDGFLLVGNLKVAHEQYFVKSLVPSVMWGRPAVEESALTYADSNNTMGAKEGVDYLIGQGRRRIATITGRRRTAGSLGGGLVEAHRRRHRNLRLVLDREARLDLVAKHHRGQVARKAAREHVVVGDGLDVAVARHGDAVLGAFELRHQILEQRVGFELGIILGHDK